MKETCINYKLDGHIKITVFKWICLNNPASILIKKYLINENDDFHRQMRRRNLFN